MPSENYPSQEKSLRVSLSLAVMGTLSVVSVMALAPCHEYPLRCVRVYDLWYLCSLRVCPSLSLSPSVRLSDILLLITLSDVSFPATSEGSFVLSLIHKHERRANFSLARTHALPSGVQFSLARALRLAPLFTLARTHSNRHPSSHSRPHTKMTTSLTSDCERHP